ncbi:uncharacterized protein [Pleurodeles waltl]|uniref:uncharacterized protein n=1 Tax=Pleurodeles waltl TaxID=8319 RepID=UPI0037099809
MVQEKLSKEVREGRMAGPFSDWPLENLIVSPIGVVPKKEKGQFWLIHHLSWPEGTSVNDFILEEVTKVSYASVDVAVAMIEQLGPGALMAKTDVKSAFRLLPVHPDDFELLGIQFQGNWYVDKALPMGCSSSCALFERFSTALQWIFQRMTGHQWVTNYLDDFFFAAPADSPLCAAVLSGFVEIMGDLGVPLAPEKTVGPTTALSFLGIELDTVEGMARLPADKKADMMERIFGMLGRSKVTVREVQVLLGHLNFACRVVRAGRTFCRRLSLALSGHALPHHHVRLKVEVHEDLRMWAKFLESFNGIPLKTCRDCEWDVQLFSDAAGAYGFGLYWEGRWCAEEWPSEWKHGGRSIAFLELFPLIVAVCLWGSELQHSRVLSRVDNMTVVQLVNRQSAREAGVLQLMHVFVLQCLRHDIHFIARYVPGANNDIADALSRSQWERFHGLTTGVALRRIYMPEVLWTVGNHGCYGWL